MLLFQIWNCRRFKSESDSSQNTFFEIMELSVCSNCGGKLGHKLNFLGNSKSSCLVPDLQEGVPWPSANLKRKEYSIQQVTCQNTKFAFQIAKDTNTQIHIPPSRPQWCRGKTPGCHGQPAHLVFEKNWQSLLFSLKTNWWKMCS